MGAEQNPEIPHPEPEESIDELMDELGLPREAKYDFMHAALDAVDDDFLGKVLEFENSRHIEESGSLSDHELIENIQTALESEEELEGPPEGYEISPEDLERGKAAIRAGLIRAYGRAEARPYPNPEDIDSLDLETFLRQQDGQTHDE